MSNKNEKRIGTIVTNCFGWYFYVYEINETNVRVEFVFVWPMIWFGTFISASVGFLKKTVGIWKQI